MCEQCVPGALSNFRAPGNKARHAAKTVEQRQIKLGEREGDLKKHKADFKEKVLGSRTSTMHEMQAKTANILKYKNNV